MASENRYGELLPLEANSAYISLTQLMQPGVFRCALFITDANAVATPYHWTQVKRRAVNTDPIETFMFSTVNPVTEITRGNTYTLVFAKIGAFTASTTFNYPAQFATIFPLSYDNVRDNRKHNLNCRTWLIAALQRMRQHGLVNMTDAQLTVMDSRLYSAGVAAEQLLAKNPKTFRTQLLTF